MKDQSIDKKELEILQKIQKLKEERVMLNKVLELLKQEEEQIKSKTK